MQLCCLGFSDGVRRYTSVCSRHLKRVCLAKSRTADIGLRLGAGEKRHAASNQSGDGDNGYGFFHYGLPWNRYQALYAASYSETGLKNVKTG